MIPSKHADTVQQALDILITKEPPTAVTAAVERLKHVVKTHAGDDTTFNPVDFTESDLSEAIKVFESAARKEIDGYTFGAQRAQEKFRSAMNDAVEQKDRIKCRVTLVVELVVAAAKKLA